MSAWVSDKALIAAALPSGYREIPLNNNPDQASAAFLHKAYELKVPSTDTRNLSSASSLSTRQVRLSIKYHDQGGKHDANRDEFETVYDAIRALRSYFGLITQPTFEVSSDDNKVSVGILNFYFGWQE